MDSERRHELETNDLREFMDNFKDFAEKHGNKILLVLIVVLGSYAGYNYYNRWKAGNIDEAYQKLADATSVETLLAVAGEYPLVHDEATRRAADLSLGQGRAIYVKYPDEVGKQKLEKAASAYTTLTEKAGTDLYKLIGYEGLAVVAVMLEDWDQASTNYSKVIDLAGDKYPFQAANAQAGLDQIEELKNPVAFTNPALQDTTGSDAAGDEKSDDKKDDKKDDKSGDTGDSAPE